MARETEDEYIAYLVEQRDMIRAQLNKHSSFKSMEAQGSSGAKTEFTDPAKLREALRAVNTELQAAYMHQGS